MTDRFTSLAPRALLGLSLLLFAAISLLAVPATAPAASKVQANLRVVTWQGKILFDGKARTGTTKIKPNKACLGGRTGPARTVSGPTALGLLVAASKKSKSLRPLKLTDTDFGFGICGIGGANATGEQWWSLRTNYKDATVGAEGLSVKRNDDILLYLSKTYMEPTPDSLFLKAPAKVKKGKLIRVRVFSYHNEFDEKSGETRLKRSPVEGAKVKGAVGPTNAKGFARIKVTRKTRTVARKSGLIPSNRAVIKLKKVKKKKQARR